MSTVPEKVLNWLYSEYRDVQRTYSDVAESLSNYPSISPRTEVYTYENGSSALLLLLSGTLPVTFRGTVYRFPVAIWVPHAYPHESPIVYVTPSQEMIVRPGQHVGGDGRVYHPYLAQWGKYWDKSTLLDFLAVLRGVFAKEPPMISKQQVQYGPPKPAQPTPPPVPPPPEELRRSNQASPPTSQLQQPAPPPKPPKPYENRAPQEPIAQAPSPSRAPQLPPKPHQSGTSASYEQRETASWRQPPSNYSTHQQNVPVFQQQHHRPITDNPPSQTPFRRTSYGSPVSPLTPTDGNPQPSHMRYQQPPPLPQQPAHPPSQPAPAQYNNQRNTYVAQLGPSNTYLPNYQQQGYAPPAVVQQPPKPKPIVPDLMDSPLEVTLPSQSGVLPSFPAPPIPPNPEKDALLNALRSTFHAQVTQTIASNTAAVAPLQAQQEALRAAHGRLQAELNELQNLDSALASNEQILVEAMREADRVMKEAKKRKVPDVDEVLVAPTVVGGQLYSLCAEERALGDALFVLGRALDKGRIGSDVFVKQTRALAREQFLKKALIKKIATGMGLDEHSMPSR